MKMYRLEKRRVTVAECECGWRRQVADSEMLVPWPAEHWARHECLEEAGAP